MTVEQFTTFAATKALTVNAAAAKFGPLDRALFVDRVTTSGWTANQLVFRNTPLLQLSDERFLTVDLQFLFESASAGLFWSLAGRLVGKPRDLFFSYWGHLFESYVQRLLGHYYESPIERTYPPDGQIDGMLVLGDDVVVFEVKAGFLPDAAKGSREPSVIDAALRKKYVTDDDDRGVGVRQLATTSKALLNGKVPDVAVRGRIYPVLVGEDPILQTLVMNTYLNDIFREENPGDRVMPLTVMLVDELEQLLPHVHAGDVSWQDLLAPRFVGERVVAESVHESFIAIAVQRHLKRRPENFLAAQTQELIAMIKDAYKDLK